MKMKKLLLALVTLFIGAALTACGETKVDLSKYVSIDYSGLDGQATASCDIDFTSLEDVWSEGKDEDLELVNMIMSFEDSIEVSLDKTENIKNGDVLTATITWDEDLAEKHDFKFTGDTKKVTVKDLSEGTEIDLFQDISLEYDGVAPEADLLTICNTSSDAFLKTVDYEADIVSNLSNGDKITITAEYDDAKAAQYEYIVNETQKTYEVSGIDEYISEYAEIDDETLDKIGSQAEDLIESELANRYDYSSDMYPDDFIMPMDMDQVKVESIDLTGAYFFTLKQGMEKEFNDVSNSIFLVYKVKATDPDSPKGVIAYIPVYYKNFIMRDTGNLDVVITDASIPETYSSMDNLYREIVTANKAKYNFEEITY